MSKSRARDHRVFVSGLSSSVILSIHGNYTSLLDLNDVFTQQILAFGTWFDVSFISSMSS
jgi:hypothetical protein